MLTIRIVGSGCPNCENLFQLCMNVAAENNLDADIQKITDREKFTEAWCMDDTWTYSKWKSFSAR